MHVIAAKAVAFKEALTPAFKDTRADREERQDARREPHGERASGCPSGGTDNHLMLVDLSSTDLTGKEAEEALERPGSPSTRTPSLRDPSPFVTSGIRIGTPAATTRGLKEPEMERSPGSSPPSWPIRPTRRTWPPSRGRSTPSCGASRSMPTG